MRTIRVWFSKTGDAVYISHLDMQRVMHRAMARAGIPAWYSQGFNPHMYITFPLPLPLGQAGLCEAMDFRTEQEDLPPAQVAAALNAVLPQGLQVHDVTQAVHGAGQIAAAEYTVLLPEADGRMAAAVQAYGQAASVIVTRPGKQDGRKTQKDVDLKTFLPALYVEEAPQGFLRAALRLPAGSSCNCNPALLTRYLQQQSGLSAAANICRTRILLADGTPFC